MADKKTEWKPDDQEALKRLIRETLLAAGPGDPGSLPHKVKERLRGQATGTLDVDAYIKEVLGEVKKG